MLNHGMTTNRPRHRAPRREWVAVLGVGLLIMSASCVQDPVIPKEKAPPIVLSMDFSTKTFRLGKADTIRVTATNNFTESATLRFASDCQIVVTIRNAAGDAVVPPNGRPLCVNIVTTLVIKAGESAVKRFVWNGANNFTPPGSITPLPPGVYFVSASINGTNYSTVAPAVKIDLVPPSP